MLNIGPQELLLILLVALVIVGPKRLPELSRTIGRGLRELRRAQDEVKDAIRLGLNESDSPSRPSSPQPADRATDVDGREPGSTSQEDPGPTPGSDRAGDGSTDSSQVGRILGRGLAELRNAREDIQRTFHVDLSGGPQGPSRDGSVTKPTVTPKPDDPASEG